MKITRETEFTVTVTFYHPAYPGRTTGPYDQCYPPEAAEIEYTLTTATGFEIPHNFFTKEEWKEIDKKILELHEEQLTDAADEAQIDNYLTYTESY